MKTHITDTLNKISWVLLIGIAICQWSCVEEVIPREISPSERFIPVQQDCTEPKPIIGTPDPPKGQESLPNKKQIGQ